MTGNDMGENDAIERDEFERRLNAFDKKLDSITELIQAGQDNLNKFALDLVKLQTEHSLVCGSQEKKIAELESSIVNLNTKAEGMQSAITGLKNNMPNPGRTIDGANKVLQLVFYIGGALLFIAGCGWFIYSIAAHIKG